MRIDENGIVRDMTAEEIAELPTEDMAEPTAEERMASIERENAELKTLVEKLLVLNGSASLTESEETAV